LISEGSREAGEAHIDARPEGREARGKVAPVSVVIPTYNRQNLVLRAALSAVFQSLPPSEIIIVDDCSSDGTVQACRQLAAAAAKLGSGQTSVRCLRLPRNSGANAARNRGVEEAQAEYLAFLDSDDIWHPEKLARQFAEIERCENPEGKPLFSYTGRLRVDETFRLLARQTASRVRLGPRLRLSNVFGTMSSILVPRALVVEVGGFDETLKACQDWDLFLRTVPKAVAAGISDPLILYFDGALDRITRAPKARLEAHIRIYKKHLRGRIERSQLTDLYFNVAEALAALDRGRCARKFYAQSLRGRYRMAAIRKLVAWRNWRRLPTLRYEKYTLDLERGESDEAYKGENAAYVAEYKAAIARYEQIAREILGSGSEARGAAQSEGQMAG
jgi:glycosyltransferase involved in cell wall biosynthesis